jgi:hypothetical protein
MQGEIKSEAVVVDEDMGSASFPKQTTLEHFNLMSPDASLVYF